MEENGKKRERERRRVREKKSFRRKKDAADGAEIIYRYEEY